MGCYRHGKFWKDETIWRAVKGMTPTPVRVSDLIRQDLVWNMGNLQDYAEEMRKVQDADLSYPIVLSTDYGIIDGAHRTVKAYLEGKAIIFAVILDIEQIPPDYDEYEAVHGKKQ